MKKHSSFFRKKHKPRASAYTIWPKNREWLVTRVKTQKKRVEDARGVNKTKVK